MFNVTKKGECNISSLIDQYSKEELELIVSTSFSYREVLSKLGYGTGSGSNNDTLKKKIELYNISTSHFTHKKRKTDWKDKEIFCEDSKVSQNTLRRTFKKREFTPYRCNICGMEAIWNNKPLTLRLDHINGKNKDNRLENLQWVCPNCDSQQDTFAGKNRRKLQKDKILFQVVDEEVVTLKSQKQPSKQPRQTKLPELPKSSGQIIAPERQELKDKLWELKNYTQVANFYNVSPKKVRQWCRQYDLPAVINIVKHTSEEGWKSENWNDYYKPNICIDQSLPCYMIDKDTDEIINKFSSRSEAARSLGVHSKNAASHIGSVCAGKRKTAFGYKWKNVD